MANQDLLLRFFLQLAVILAVCRLIGMGGRRLGQPQVVCEVIAGILLGPTLFGLVWPTAQQALFPLHLTVAGISVTSPSMSILYVLSHLALALYMFLVGLEFDFTLMRGHVRRAASISLSGIFVPFVLGGVCGLLLYRQGNLFGQHVTPGLAALFLGTSLSITALPVLARLLQQFGITRTRLGSLVLTMASVNDIVAWCLLALVLASIGRSPGVALITICGGALYSVAMLTLGHRGLRWFDQQAERTKGMTNDLLVLVLLVVLVCAWLTSAIGIYEVFGAFVAGVAMPRGNLATALQHRLEDVTTSVLLPIFFVYSGLNTRIGLLNTPQLWLLTAVVILMAVAGKGVACTLAARLSRYSWRESATIGALMNTRGLIELIVLNIGVEAGIITPTLFTILVLMALVTTLMAAPLYRWLSGAEAGKARASAGTDLPGVVATSAAD